MQRQDDHRGVHWVGRRPSPASFPWAWALACLALGLCAGTFFRWRQMTGIGVMEMFGFWCLVGAGLVAARFFTLLQVGDARARLLAALDSLGEPWTAMAVPASWSGRGGPEYLVLRPDAAFLLGRSDLSASARSRKARRALARAAAELADRGNRLLEALRAASVPLPPRVEHVLVLTRRRVDGPVLDSGVWQVNPEHVRSFLRQARAQGAAGSPPATEEAGPPPAEAASPAGLRERLQAWWEEQAGRRHR